MHLDFCMRNVKEEIVTKKVDKKKIEAYMNDYRKRIKWMTLPALREEWETVRRKLNPNCKKWERDIQGETDVSHKEENANIHSVFPVCSKCEYCSSSELEKGRLEFVCTNEDAGKHNPYRIDGENGPEYFICYSKGENGKMKTKTSPRWCPKRWGE